MVQIHVRAPLSKPLCLQQQQGEFRKLVFVGASPTRGSSAFGAIANTRSPIANVCWLSAIGYRLLRAASGDHDVTAASRPVTAFVPVQIRLVTPISMGRSLWIIAQQNETECGVAQRRQSTWAQVRETQVRGLPPVSKPQHFLSIENLPRHLLKRCSAQNRIREMVARLNHLNVPLDADSVFSLANCQSPGRPHVARALVQAGLCGTLDEAFERFLKKNRPAWVPKFKMSAAEGISLIHEAGGVAIMAHPGLNRSDEVIPGMVEAGLDGLECFHTKHNASTVERVISSCSAKIPWNSRSNVSDHKVNPFRASISSALMRTRLPSRRTVPSSTCSTIRQVTPRSRIFRINSDSSLVS